MYRNSDMQLKYTNRLDAETIKLSGEENIKHAEDLIKQYESKLLKKGYTHAEIVTLGGVWFRKQYAKQRFIPLNTMVVIRFYTPKNSEAYRMMEDCSGDPVEQKIPKGDPDYNKKDSTWLDKAGLKVCPEEGYT